MCLPFVSMLTSPPGFHSRSGTDILCGSAAVSRRMPLFGDIGSQCCKIVYSRYNHPVAANRTMCRLPAFSSDTSSPTYLCFPFVTVFRTLPPVRLVAACHYLIRSDVSIFLPIPFSSDFRILACQIIEPRSYGAIPQ